MTQATDTRFSNDEPALDKSSVRTEDLLQNPTAQLPSEPMSHTECVQAATRYLSKRCPVVLPEFYSWNSELPDVIGFGRYGSTLIECKVSRADFLKDAKKQFRILPETGMGDVRYYCCPKGLIKKEELPEGWGLLYVYPSGAVREQKESRPFEKNEKAEFHLLFYYARRANYAGVHQTIIEYRGYDS